MGANGGRVRAGCRPCRVSSVPFLGPGPAGHGPVRPVRGGTGRGDQVVVEDSPVLDGLARKASTTPRSRTADVLIRVPFVPMEVSLMR